MVTPPPSGPPEALDPARLVADVYLDERGRRCPLPIIALGKAAAQVPAGTVLSVRSDDAAARHDVPAWCSMRAAAFLGSIDHGDHTEYFVRTAQ